MASSQVYSFTSQAALKPSWPPLGSSVLIATEAESLIWFMSPRIQQSARCSPQKGKQCTVILLFYVCVPNRAIAPPLPRFLYRVQEGCHAVSHVRVIPARQVLLDETQATNILGARGDTTSCCIEGTSQKLARYGHMLAHRLGLSM